MSRLKSLNRCEGRNDKELLWDFLNDIRKLDIDYDISASEMKKVIMELGELKLKGYKHRNFWASNGLLIIVTILLFDLLILYVILCLN